ncbi:MAG: HesB/IscA family protein [Mariprofundaceae bacterium]
MNETTHFPEPDMELSSAAMNRLSETAKKQGYAGVRISVRAAGCSGLKYVMDYADEPEDDDYVKRFEGFSIYIDPASYKQALIGLRLDYQEDALSSGFVFANPNKKGECGCGASFTV